MTAGRARWLGPILAVYWLMIFTATHLPQAALPPTHLGDKTEHFLAYAILAALAVPWLHVRFGVRRPWLWALPLLFAYGAIDELTQPIVNRYCDLRDWLADALGTAVGVLAATSVMFLRRP